MTGDIFFYDILGPSVSPWWGSHTFWFIITSVVLLGFLVWQRTRQYSDDMSNGEQLSVSPFSGFDFYARKEEMKEVLEASESLSTERFLVMCYMQLQPVFVHADVQEMTSFSLEEMEHQRFYLKQHLHDEFLNHLTTIYHALFGQEVWSHEQHRDIIEMLIADVESVVRKSSFIEERDK